MLTSKDVMVQDFLKATYGFHYFTLPSIVGHRLHYAWIGNYTEQCLDIFVYPFAFSFYMTGKPDFQIA